MDLESNLLFGVLALQIDLIDSNQFAEVCTLWSTNKTVPLADLMIDHGWITATDRGDVERLLSRRLKKHEGDLKASLADAMDGSVHRTLMGVQNPEIERTLINLQSPGESELSSTVNYLPVISNRYSLTTLHATGGIGQVWIARDEQLGRDVARRVISTTIHFDRQLHESCALRTWGRVHLLTRLSVRYCTDQLTFRKRCIPSIYVWIRGSFHPTYAIFSFTPRMNMTVIFSVPEMEFSRTNWTVNHPVIILSFIFSS